MVANLVVDPTCLHRALALSQPGPPHLPQTFQMDQKEFFAEATESQRYKLTEVIGKGSYGVVASATDQFTGTLGVYWVWDGGSGATGTWLESCWAVCSGSMHVPMWRMDDSRLR